MCSILLDQIRSSTRPVFACVVLNILKGFVKLGVSFYLHVRHFPLCRLHWVLKLHLFCEVIYHLVSKIHQNTFSSMSKPKARTFPSHIVFSTREEGIKWAKNDNAAVLLGRDSIRGTWPDFASLRWQRTAWSGEAARILSRRSLAGILRSAHE